MLCNALVPALHKHLSGNRKRFWPSSKTLMQRFFYSFVYDWLYCFLRSNTSRQHLCLRLWKVSALSHCLALRCEILNVCATLRVHKRTERMILFFWYEGVPGALIHRRLCPQYEVSAFFSTAKWIRMDREIITQTDQREGRAKSRTPIHIQYWQQIWGRPCHASKNLTSVYWWIGKQFWNYSCFYIRQHS